MVDAACTSENCKCEKFTRHIFKHDVCINCFHKSHTHINLTQEDTNYIEIYNNDKIPSKILDNLYMGSMYAALNIKELKNLGITHIINCALNLNKFFPNFKEYKEEFTYLNLPLIDNLTCNIKPYVIKSLDFIQEAINNNGKVFIHCAQGVSRSGSIVVGYLMKTYNISFDEALHIAKQGRIICNPNKNFRSQLIEMKNDNEI